LTEVRPPWIEYPDVPPDDFFWREAGEPWRVLVWEPYYNSLSAREQERYLIRWDVREIWRESWFEKARQEFWDHVDDPD